jgi:hypothetical protein
MVSTNLWELLGGRDGVISLLPVDPKDLKASTLRDALFDENHVSSDGTLKGRFDSLYLQAGYSARDLFELFDSRQHATALVVASAAKPRLVGELVDAASQRVVPCYECGGTMQVARTDPDGAFLEWAECTIPHCDDRGNVVIDGNKAARELYFDQFGFKQSAPFVNIDARSDNRKVEFHVGMQGTAPSPLALIRALESVPDVDAPKRLTEASVVEQQKVMSDIVEAEVIGK